MQKGFTLIELMITLVVLVVALGIGVPNFVTWMKSNRLDTSSHTIAAVLQLARNEAVTRQTVITIGAGTTTAPGSWANGAHIYTDTSAAGNTAYNVADTLIQDIDTTIGGITINNDDDNNFISFTSSGLLNEGAGAQRTFRFCQSTGEIQGISLIINSVGRTSINNIGDCP